MIALAAIPLAIWLYLLLARGRFWSFRGAPPLRRLPDPRPPSSPSSPRVTRQHPSVPRSPRSPPSNTPARFTSSSQTTPAATTPPPWPATLRNPIASPSSPPVPCPRDGPGKCGPSQKPYPWLAPPTTCYSPTPISCTRRIIWQAWWPAPIPAPTISFPTWSACGAPVLRSRRSSPPSSSFSSGSIRPPG